MTAYIKIPTIGEVLNEEFLIPLKRDDLVIA